WLGLLERDRELPRPGAARDDQRRRPRAVPRRGQSRASARRPEAGARHPDGARDPGHREVGHAPRAVNHLDGGQRAMLLRVARRAMTEHGLEPDFAPAALAEARQLAAPASPFGPDVRDLRGLDWCSIDNDDSLDLDQLTVAAGLAGDSAHVLVAVADVSASVPPGSALDGHAAANTTSVYTPPRNFPMLPERLSTDLTSLDQDQDRLAIVIEVMVDGAGSSGTPNVYRAAVRNKAKLAYSSVGAWLEGKGAMPPAIGAVPGLADNLRLQDQVARRLRADRHEHGALELESLEVRARLEGDAVVGLEREERNRAKELIEDFMIAAN